VVELAVPGGEVVPTVRLEFRLEVPADVDLLRAQLRGLHALGAPVALLAPDGPAATVPAVAALGFGPAGLAISIELDLPTGPGEGVGDGLGVGAGLDVRAVGPEEGEAIVPVIHERHRRRQPGQVGVPADRWSKWFAAPPPGGRGFLVAGSAGGPDEGAVVWSREGDRLVVDDLVAMTDRARRALWHAVLALGDGGRLVAHDLPVDEPLPWMLADPAALRITGRRPTLPLRLVDVATALGARRYATADELVMEVADPVLPDNAGRHRLHGSPDGAACLRTQDPPDLTLTPAELATAYLGGITLTTLARAGRVVEHRPGSLQRADAMFSWRPAPAPTTVW
jgi:hypothetical protein